MKYARKCSVTNKGINEGWHINGEWYSTQELANIAAREMGYKDFSNMYDCNNNDELDEDEDEIICTEDVYWTSFEEDLESEIEDSYFTEDGIEIFN